MGTVVYTDAGGTTHNLGPWLKDVPFNAGHYQIEVTNDGKGTIGIFTPVTTAEAAIATCSAVK